MSRPWPNCTFFMNKMCVYLYQITSVTNYTVRQIIFDVRWFGFQAYVQIVDKKRLELFSEIKMIKEFHRIFFSPSGIPWEKITVSVKIKNFKIVLLYLTICQETESANVKSILLNGVIISIDMEIIWRNAIAFQIWKLNFDDRTSINCQLHVKRKMRVQKPTDAMS